MSQELKLVAREVSGVDKDGLRALVDQHRARIKSGVVVLAAPGDDKGHDRGWRHAGSHQEGACGPGRETARRNRGGRGRADAPDFAEAGGKDLSKVGENACGHARIIERC